MAIFAVFGMTAAKANDAAIGARKPMRENGAGIPAGRQQDIDKARAAEILKGKEVDQLAPGVKTKKEAIEQLPEIKALPGARNVHVREYKENDGVGDWVAV